MPVTSSWRSRRIAMLLLPWMASGCMSRPAGKPSAPEGSAAARHTVVRSNVTREDYAGSAACVPCHPSETEAWARSPMHRMTRDGRDGTVRAPFDGTRWTFKGDAATLERRGQDRYLRIDSETGATTTYRVTRIIGGRTREDFAGIDVASGGDELVLPVSYVYATSALRYKGYSVMVHERATLRAGPVWSRTCIFCHNTAPELDRIVGALAGRRGHAYQAEQVDWLLPAARRRRAQVTDRTLFAADVAGEVTRLGGRMPPEGGGGGGDASLAQAAIDVVRSGFDARSLVEVGIGCEACHGGAREHAADPAVKPSIEPRAPWLQVSTPGSSKAQSENRMCARCHQVLFSKYPFTWEGGRRTDNPGGSHIASGEARDFLLGGCADKMSCTACHDPHGGSPSDALRRLGTVAGNATCTSCHSDLLGADRLKAHAHHDPGAAGAACVACHMPRKNMGLDGTLTRYHRIGSPTDPERVLGDRPLECALCHSDRTVNDLVEAMEQWWPVRYPRQRLIELYGSLDANVIRATLERGHAHEQAVAIGVLGEARARDAIGLLTEQVDNPYPLVGLWARRALEAMGAQARPVASQGRQLDGTDEDPED